MAMTPAVAIRKIKKLRRDLADLTKQNPIALGEGLLTQADSLIKGVEQMWTYDVGHSDDEEGEE